MDAEERYSLRDFVMQTFSRLLKRAIGAQQSDDVAYVYSSVPQPPPELGIQSDNSAQRSRHFPGYGRRTRPPAGSEFMVFAPRGGTGNAAAIGSDNLGYGPTDLEDGEVVEYGPAHTNGGVSCMRWKSSGEVTLTTAEATIQIASTGQINITAKTAENVVFNGGTLRVARKTDPVGYLCIQTAVVSGTTVVTEAKWSATVLPPPYVCTAITIQDGAEHVKA